MGYNVKRIIEGHEKDLRGADLAGTYLRGADLANAKLSGTKLSGADITRANLTKADLRGANLRGAYLAYSDLSKADLSKADLTGTYLRGADLRGADLDYSCLPLWCGSFDMKMDSRQLAQIAYHLVRLMEVSDDIDEMDRKSLMSPKFVDFANRFHRAGECGRVYGLGR